MLTVFWIGVFFGLGVIAGVLIAVAILGGMKGHLIPDYDEQQASADWRMALIDVVGTVLVFFTLCHFIFK